MHIEAVLSTSSRVASKNLKRSPSANASDILKKSGRIYVKQASSPAIWHDTFASRIDDGEGDIAGPEYVGYPVCPKTVILALDGHPSDFTTLADVPDA